MGNNLEINGILKDFYAISGIRISIHDTEFNEIYSYPQKKSVLCSYIQQKSAVLNECKQNDYKAFKKVKSTGEIYIYKCNRGLYEAVAPIYNFGTLSGYLMMGQICDNEPYSVEYVFKKATEIIGDAKTAEEICKNVKIIDKNLLYSYINIMTVLAEYLTSSNKINNHADRVPRLIAEYINKNYASKITLSILSQKFGCCNTTLTKCFKKEYKTSIMEYLREIRLKKAEELILNTNKNFKEISALCGFYDQNYFSKVFTDKYKCSPTQYRAKSAKNKIILLDG